MGAPKNNPASTRKLLTAGMIAGPLFVAIALIQAFTRDGFDIVKHPTSSLSLGDLGWIQIINFIVAGLLFTACAVGIRRVLQARPGRIWAPLLVGIFGVALIVGGIFVPDAGLGFPPGAPEGFAEPMSWHATVHALAPAIGPSALTISFFVFARYFASLKQHAWMITSITVGVVVLALVAVFNITVSPDGDNFNFLTLWAVIVLGFSWISVIAGKLKSTV